VGPRQRHDQLNFNIFSGGPGPQSNRPYQVHILGNTWYRLQYRHHMNDLLDGPLSPAVFNAFITELEAAIGPAFAEDPNNMMDWHQPGCRRRLASSRFASGSSTVATTCVARSAPCPPRRSSTALAEPP
jgi:hypothetical protein